MVMAVGMVSAKTRTKYATSFSIDGSSSTYEGSTYTWTGNSNGLWLFNNLNLDLSQYNILHVSINDKTSGAGWQIKICVEGNYSTKSYTGTTFYTSTSTDIDLREITLSPAGTINRIEICGYLNGLSTASFTINPSDVYLTGEYEGMEINTTIDSEATVSSPFQWYTSTDGTTKVEVVSGSLTKRFETAGIKEIFSKSTSNLGYGNGFIDIAGYDDFTVDIGTYDESKDNQVRLLRVTGEKTTENFNVNVTSAGATTASLSSLASRWIAGIWTKANSSNSQAVSSFVFTKDYDAASTTAFSIAASAKSAVAYDRSFTVGRKSTVCLPFALTAPEVASAGTFYELYEVADGVLKFREVTTTEAYTPYVFEALTATPFASLSNKAIVATPAAASGYATTVGDYTFQGTLAHQSLPSGVYGYNAGTGVFSKTTTDAVTIDAFRAYISTTSGARELKCTFGDDETTGIETVNHKPLTVNHVYNLAGQRVSEDHKGLVIRNGHKVMVK